MAFVEVIRRSMRPEEWTDLRYAWIKRSLIGRQHEITSLEIRDAVQTGENGYEFVSDYRPLQKGDLYFTPDGTAFIKGKVTIPEDFREGEIWFMLHTAAEMMVKINGKYAGGIDPNRNRILLNPWLQEGSYEFTVEIEGYNRSKPDDERNVDSMHLRGCRQIFEGAFVSVVNQDLQDLYYDLTVLLDIAKSPHFDEDYREFLNRELNQALNKIDFDTFEGAGEALKYIEEHIYQNQDFHTSGNVALIGHSHLDIAYYWRRMHVVQKNARTILIQMRLMDQYPEFKYAHTQPYTYELLAKYYPELFAELKEKIKAGQFEPVGAMYVEPDCNVPSAESLIRQCLYGQHYYREAFGITVDNAWLPDVFGNSWILPQILKKSGVDYFVSNKMSTWNDTNRFPHNNFLWKGIDGSQVYACVPPTHFITWNMP
ncbi:MAG: alpha-mannosidase, partial [Lachnospiraceae bacterium]|nr:alpha-mannosidase [Lachnospiraceae bacterium]